MRSGSTATIRKGARRASLLDGDGCFAGPSVAAVSAAAISRLLLAGRSAIARVLAAGQQQADGQNETDGAEECASCMHHPYSLLMGLRKCLQPRRDILPAPHRFVTYGEFRPYRRFFALPA